MNVDPGSPPSVVTIQQDCPRLRSRFLQSSRNQSTRIRATPATNDEEIRKQRARATY